MTYGTKQEEALHIAADRKWHPVAGSDAHNISVVGETFTAFDKLAPDEKSLARAIKNGLGVAMRFNGIDKWKVNMLVDMSIDDAMEITGRPRLIRTDRVVPQTFSSVSHSPYRPGWLALYLWTETVPLSGTMAEQISPWTHRG